MTHFEATYMYTGVYLAKNVWGGNMEELLDTNGPPLEPKGVGAGGGCGGAES